MDLDTELGRIKKFIAGVGPLVPFFEHLAGNPDAITKVGELVAGLRDFGPTIEKVVADVATLAGDVEAFRGRLEAIEGKLAEHEPMLQAMRPEFDEHVAKVSAAHPTRAREPEPEERQDYEELPANERARESRDPSSTP